MNKIILSLIIFGLITSVTAYIYKLRSDKAELLVTVEKQVSEINSLNSALEAKSIELEKTKQSHEVTLKTLEDIEKNKKIIDETYLQQTESLSNIIEKDYMSTIVPKDVVDFLNNSDIKFRDNKSK